MARGTRQGFQQRIAPSVSGSRAPAAERIRGSAAAHSAKPVGFEGALRMSVLAERRAASFCWAGKSIDTGKDVTATLCRVCRHRPAALVKPAWPHPLLLALIRLAPGYGGRFDASTPAVAKARLDAKEPCSLG